MRKIESVAFDLEGTVIDVEYAHHEGHRLAARDFYVELSLEECLQLIPHFIGGPDDEVAKEISQLLQKRQGTKIDYREVLLADKKHYGNLLQELKIEPRKGFVNFFQAIKDRGLKYAIGSLTDENQAKLLLERGGIIDLFGSYKNIVLREHVKNLKPAPDVWIETARRTSVDPAEQLIFEDSPRGIQGGVQVSAYCIGMPVYNKPSVIMPLLEAGARRVFIQWDEINPHKLIDNINRELAQ